MKKLIIITLLALIVSTDTFTLPTSNNQLNYRLIRTDVTILSCTAVVNEYSLMTTLPRHPNNNDANDILKQTEEALQSMQETILLDRSTTAKIEDDITNKEDIPKMLNKNQYMPIPMLTWAKWIQLDSIMIILL